MLIIFRVSPLPSIEEVGAANTGPDMWAFFDTCMFAIKSSIDLYRLFERWLKIIHNWKLTKVFMTLTENILKADCKLKVKKSVSHKSREKNLK